VGLGGGKGAGAPKDGQGLKFGYKSSEGKTLGRETFSPSKREQLKVVRGGPRRGGQGEVHGMYSGPYFKRGRGYGLGVESGHGDLGVLLLRRKGSTKGAGECLRRQGSLRKGGSASCHGGTLFE